MSGRSGRVVSKALAVCLILTAAAYIGPGSGLRAGLLAPRPGPIDRPLAFAVADLNRDGFDDLIVANFQSGTLTLLLNQHDGTFALGPGSPETIGAASFGFPTPGPLSLAVGDLNPDDVDSDGVPNATDDCPNTPNASTVASGKQVDSGTCVGGSNDTNSCQVDADCPSGFCQGNGVGDLCEVMKTDANGTVTGTLDSDGDGVPDYDPNFDPTNPSTALDNCPLAYNPGQEPTAKGPNGLCGDGDDNSSLFGPDGQCGTLDDLRSPVGDACAVSPDVVILGNSLGGGSPLGIVRVRLNDGLGDFVSRPSKVTDIGASQIILADFTGDGKPDIAQSNALSGTVLFYKGQTDGTFSTDTVLATGAGPQGLASADIDGNGSIDLAVANRTAGTIGIYLSQNGTLPTGASTTLMLDARSRPTGLLAGSINGDACGDLITLDQGSGSMCVGGTKDGSGCTLDSECPSGTCSPGVCIGGTKVGAGCAVNTDCPGGSCDTGGSGDAQIEVFGSTGCGAGSFLLANAQTISLGPAARPTGGLLRDLDGDSVPDLAIADFAGGSVLIFRGIGDGTFATPAVATLPGLSNPVALATLDYDADGRPDLAVLEFAADRVDLYHNDGGFAFSISPGSPASGWKGSSAMAMFGADSLAGIDTVLLHRSPPRLDVLSGIGNVFFRPTPFTGTGAVSLLMKKPLAPCTGGFCSAGSAAASACTTDADCPGTADAMLVADVHQDGIPDVVVVDTPGSTLTTLQSSPSGGFSETATTPVAPGPTRATAGSLILYDYDRDGVPDYQDDCPFVYNPPDCKGDGSTNPRCKVDQPCALNPPSLDCTTKDPVSGQCDSDADGVGDQCELLSITCGTLDTDGDGIPDYSPTTHKLDNCPTFANPLQQDTETAAGPDLSCGTLDDYPPYYGPDGLCGGGDDLATVGDRIGDFCPDSVNNVVAVSPPAGSLTVLDGGGTGIFHRRLFPRLPPAPQLLEQTHEGYPRPGIGGTGLLDRRPADRPGRRRRRLLFPPDTGVGAGGPDRAPGHERSAGLQQPDRHPADHLPIRHRQPQPGDRRPRAGDLDRRDLSGVKERADPPSGAFGAPARRDRPPVRRSL
ncbi:MAG: hypothetical protein DMF50_04915, partial [Acidobacteria bacterium]